MEFNILQHVSEIMVDISHSNYHIGVDSCFCQLARTFLVAFHDGKTKNLEMSERNDDNRGCMF